MLLEMLDNVCLPYLSQSNKICTYNAMCMSELYLLNDFQGELVLVMYDSVCLCVCVCVDVCQSNMPSCVCYYAVIVIES